MTERLYYRDPGLLTFEASILEQRELEGMYHTRLDRSAFYPTSGGQLFDLGELNQIPLTGVMETEDGEVWHVSDLSIGPVGATVTGRIDAQRRQKNRQQHTAQHILSALFVKLFGYETVSVHLGEEYGAIELAASSIETDQLGQVERAAAGVLAENISVTIRFAQGDEIAALPLRKKPERSGPLRVIQIGELDCSACGGTHCHMTSEVGLIKVIGFEKIRGHVLVRFLAGTQALDDYSLRFDVTDSISRALTCAVRDLPAVISSLQTDNKGLRKELAAAQKELLPVRAAALAATATDENGRKVVMFEAGTMDPSTAGQLAGLVAESIGGIALSVADGRLLVAVAQNSKLHAGELAKQLTVATGLKGGGSMKLAQLGGAQSEKLSQYKDALLAIIGDA